MELIDASLSLLQSGVGTIEADLEPGVYKIRISGGGDSREEFLVVEAGTAARDVRAPTLELQSAMPVSSDVRTIEQQALLSAALEQSVYTEHLGTGAMLVLCLRATGDEWTVNFPHFRLRRVDGTLLVDTSNQPGLEGRRFEGIQVLALNLAPGAYLLCHEPIDGIHTALPVNAVRQWRSEYFIGVDFPYRSEASGMAGVPDLAGTCITMHRMGSAANLGGRELRVAELARSSLIAGKPAVSQDELATLLYGKFDNPILGLLAAQLLLMQGGPDVSKLSLLCDHLEHMLQAEFPDVIALRLWLHKHPTKSPYPARVSRKPSLHKIASPLLRRNWDILVGGSRGVKSTLPPLTVGPWLGLETRFSHRTGVGEFTPAPTATGRPRVALPTQSQSAASVLRRDRGPRQREARASEAVAETHATGLYQAMIERLRAEAPETILLRRALSSDAHGPLTRLERSLLGTVQMAAQQHARELTSEFTANDLRESAKLSWAELDAVLASLCALLGDRGVRTSRPRVSRKPQLFNE